MTSTTSCRAVIAAAARPPAVAPRCAAEAASAFTNRDGEIARAEKIVDALMPWGIDANRAAQFIECVRTYDPHDGWDPKLVFALEWMGENAPQSLDWLFWGDVKGQGTSGFRHSEATSASSLPMTRAA